MPQTHPPSAPAKRGRAPRKQPGKPFLKVFIVVILLTIVGSLGSALYYLARDRERSPRTVKALTIRIGLSIGLFLLLLLAYAAGLIRPHGLRPPAEKPSPEMTGSPR